MSSTPQMDREPSGERTAHELFQVVGITGIRQYTLMSGFHRDPFETCCTFWQFFRTEK